LERFASILKAKMMVAGIFERRTSGQFKGVAETATLRLSPESGTSKTLRDFGAFIVAFQ
jgi:hypothetical protein